MRIVLLFCVETEDASDGAGLDLDVQHQKHKALLEQGKRSVGDLLLLMVLVLLLEQIDENERLELILGAAADGSVRLGGLLTRRGCVQADRAIRGRLTDNLNHRHLLS